MGTSAIWQSTDQTVGHGAAHSGRGSRRRVRLFRVGADTFAQLQRGEAIIHTTLAGTPQRTHVLRTQLPDAAPVRIGSSGRHSCEIAVYPADTLEAGGTDSQSEAAKPARAATGKTPNPEPQRLFEDV